MPKWRDKGNQLRKTNSAIIVGGLLLLLALGRALTTKQDRKLTLRTYLIHRTVACTAAF
jgi:hypothetical protein